MENSKIRIPSFYPKLVQEYKTCCWYSYTRNANSPTAGPDAMFYSSFMKFSITHPV